MNIIRPLTEMEKLVTAKYRAQLAYHEAEAAKLRTLLGDMAIAFAGREGVLMSDDALLEPEE